MSDKNEVFAELGRAIAEQLGTDRESHVESAIEKLEDDDLVAFGLVAIRDGPEGLQTAGQRCIDPVVVQEDERDPEDVIGALHGTLCNVWDDEVVDHRYADGEGK